MSLRRKEVVALGLRAQRGGAVVVGVAVERREPSAPRVVFSSHLSTAAEGDRLTLEPYHVAAEMERGRSGAPLAKTVAAVADARKRQDKLAETGLKAIAAQLRGAGFEPSAAVLLVNRAGWVDDLLAYSIAFADHPPVAEGLAVRDALRFAARRARLDLIEMDEKSLPDLGREVLGTGAAALDARLKALGVTAGKPWRKEQKLACLAAWVSLVRAR